MTWHTFGNQLSSLRFWSVVAATCFIFLMEIYFHILVVHVCWNKNAMCIISNIARLLPWFGQVKNINVSRQNRKSNQSEARGASWVEALQWSGLLWIEHETWRDPGNNWLTQCSRPILHVVHNSRAFWQFELFSFCLFLLLVTIGNNTAKPTILWIYIVKIGLLLNQKCLLVDIFHVLEGVL